MKKLATIAASILSIAAGADAVHAQSTPPVPESEASRPAQGGYAPAVPRDAKGVPTGPEIKAILSEPDTKSPPPPDNKAAEAATKESDPLAQFAWLDGCWSGDINQREIREHWLPLRGGIMLGASHIVTSGKTQSYEYLRLEPRADGIYYVNISMAPEKQETPFKFVNRSMDREDEIFTF